MAVRGPRVGLLLPRLRLIWRTRSVSDGVCFIETVTLPPRRATIQRRTERAALEKLTATERAVILLRDYSGLSLPKPPGDTAKPG